MVPARDMLFLSHANPEDNEFTLWLSLQLAKEGYPVWCDLTKLLGGEDFWKNVEEAIRERAIKFIFVLSKTSNRKEGPLNELRLAKTVAKNLRLKDFVIPVLIDDLSHSDINIELTRIAAIPFNKGWAHGLKILLEKLELDEVSKSAKFTPDAVSSWWRSQFSADQGILTQPDDYLSNWFMIETLPQNIYFHEISRRGTGLIELPSDLPYPAFQYYQYMVSFAPANDFAGKLDPLSIANSRCVSTDDFMNGNFGPVQISRQEARNFVCRLLRMAWEGLIKDRRLPTYELANSAQAFYFSKGLVKGDNIGFLDIDGKKRDRDIVGYRTTAKDASGQTISKRFWHFAIQSKPIVYPIPAYVIKPHVLFSDDGKQIWESKRLAHRARRSQCKNWWNPEWRDRTLASVAWLADHKSTIEISLGSDVGIVVSRHPATFSSPVSYLDPEKEQLSVEEPDNEAEEQQGDEE